MADFQKSKSIGKFGENLVSNYLKLGKIEVSSNDDKNTRSHYDLICKLGTKKFTIEVKLDYLATKTQNLAIEIKNTKTSLPSGLMCTLSDIWCVCLKDYQNWTIWMIKTKKLKEYVKSQPGKLIIGAGDGNADILLYKMDIILPLFSRIDNILPEKIAGIVKSLLK